MADTGFNERGGGGGGGGEPWRRQKTAKGEGAGGPEARNKEYMICMHEKCMDNKIMYKSSNAKVGANILWKKSKAGDRSVLFMKYHWH